MAIVYQHKTKDTDEIFYIGIGVARRRAYSKHGRNKHWNNIVNKHGHYYEVLFEDVTREEAIQIEQYLISYYGRRDLGTGQLVNMTGGGDGHLNPTDEQIIEISKIYDLNNVLDLIDFARAIIKKASDR